MTDRKRADLQRDVTPRERALIAVDGRLEDIDLDLLRRVRSVKDAPVEYLPFLAGERSVDVYDPAWPASVKRAVIAAAPAVHRRKGTEAAVSRALGALGIRTSVVPWHAPGGTGVPYTFTVTCLVQGRLYDGPLLDERTVRVAYATVLATKPLSRAFRFAIAAGMPVGVSLAPVLNSRATTRAVMRPDVREEFGVGLGLASVFTGRATVPAVMRPKAREEFVRGLSLVSVAVARVRIAVSMIAEAIP